MHYYIIPIPRNQGNGKILIFAFINIYLAYLTYNKYLISQNISYNCTISHIWDFLTFFWFATFLWPEEVFQCLGLSADLAADFSMQILDSSFSRYKVGRRSHYFTYDDCSNTYENVLTLWLYIWLHLNIHFYYQNLTESNFNSWQPWHSQKLQWYC